MVCPNEEARFIGTKIKLRSEQLVTAKRRFQDFELADEILKKEYVQVATNGECIIKDDESGKKD